MNGVRWDLYAEVRTNAVTFARRARFTVEWNEFGAPSTANRVSADESNVGPVRPGPSRLSRSPKMYWLDLIVSLSKEDYHRCFLLKH